MAYLEHATLGARYRECIYALQDLVQSNPENVFGPVDARKTAVIVDAVRGSCARTSVNGRAGPLV